jgi:aspartate racemase
MTKNNKLGIIGGAGPYASSLLYHSIVKQAYTIQMQSPEIFLINYPFTRGLSVEESRISGPILHKELQYCFDCLFHQGVDQAIIACNTLHAFLEGTDLKGIQLFSIPQAVLKEAETNRIKRLLVLSTQTTAANGLYQHERIQTIFPKPEEQEIVDAVINRILEGKIKEADSKLLSRLIQGIFKETPFEGVALSCTDLPVLHHFYPLHFEQGMLLDSIQIPAQHILQSHLERKI